MVAYQPLQASPSAAVTASREPTYVTFREHYCFSPSVPVPLHDDGDFENSFLPQGCRIVAVKVNSLLVYLLTTHISNFRLLSYPGWGQHH
jgi:hypothetical protein